MPLSCCEDTVSVQPSRRNQHFVPGMRICWQKSSRFGVNWEAIYKAYFLTAYNPLENYSMLETRKPLLDTTTTAKRNQGRVYERHTDFLNKHSFLQSKSVLSVIGKSYWENYHSLLIKYVLENRNGGRILRHFLQSSGVKTAWIDYVDNQTYNVETEHE